jgi:hypothetical protein
VKRILDAAHRVLMTSGLSYGGLARRTGIAKGTLSDVFLRKRVPSLETVVRLLAALAHHLEVVPDAPGQEPPIPLLTDQEYARVAVARLEATGDRAARAHLGKAIGRDRAAVTRVLAGGALTPEARVRLLTLLAADGSAPSRARN